VAAGHAGSQPLEATTAGETGSAEGERDEAAGATGNKSNLKTNQAKSPNPQSKPARKAGPKRFDLRP